MSLIIGMIFLALFIYLCKKLSGYFIRTALHLKEQQDSKEYHEACIREALADIREAVAVPKVEAINYKDRLLRANQELVRKNELNTAIEKELGIEI